MQIKIKSYIYSYNSLFFIIKNRYNLNIVLKYRVYTEKKQGYWLSIS